MTASPITNNDEIVLDTLIVDICGLLVQGHGDFCITNAGSSGGHACGQALQRAHCACGPVGKVKHRPNDDDDGERMKSGWRLPDPGRTNLSFYCT